MKPVHIPEEWDDNDLLTFEQFCELIHCEPRTARGWRSTGRGPRFGRPEGTGRLVIRVGEVRRWLGLPTKARPGPPAEHDQIGQIGQPATTDQADKHASGSPGHHGRDKASADSEHGEEDSNG